MINISSEIVREKVPVGEIQRMGGLLFVSVTRLFLALLNSMGWGDASLSVSV